MKSGAAFWLGFMKPQTETIIHYVSSGIPQHMEGELYCKSPEIEIERDNALSSINSLISSVGAADYPIYLLIDEYDNFANEVMMKNSRNNYEALVYEEGPLKTLFKTIKSSASESLFDRTFITGVSPIVMSDITSGYIIAKNIYLDAEFNDLCGFTEKEISDVIEKIVEKCGFETKVSDVLDIMRVYYNGYTFTYEARSNIYNPTLATGITDGK